MGPLVPSRLILTALQAQNASESTDLTRIVEPARGVQRLSRG